VKLAALRELLFAETPFLIWRLRQSGAVKQLLASSDAACVEPLVDALVEGHRLAPRIRGALEATVDPARIELMWERWDRRREDALELVLRASRRLPAEPTLRMVALLKLRAADQLPLDADTAHALLRRFSDDDSQVRAGCETWLLRARAGAPDHFFGTLLRLRRFKEIGATRPVMDHVVRLLRGDAGLGAEVEAWIATLPEDARLMATLKAGRPALAKVREQAFALAPFFGDVDPEVRNGAERYLASLDDDPGLALLLHLKIRRSAALSVDPRTMRAVFDLVIDSDADVRAEVLAYARRLPIAASENDALYDFWIRTGSAEVAAVISDQSRLPTSPAKEALFHVGTGRVGRYHALGDQSGSLFREAFALATPGLRARLGKIVMESRDVRLVDAYASAIGSNRGTEWRTTLEARKAAGDEDGLFEAARTLAIGDLLDLVEHWRSTGRRPKETNRKRAVDAAVTALERLGGKVEFDPPPDLPEGLVDFFTWWEEQGLDEKALRQNLSAPDPFVRAGAAWALHRKAGLPSGQTTKMAASDDWPERFVARLADPGIPVPENEHVRFTSMLHDVVADVVLSSTAGGSPAENQRLREVSAARGRAGGRAATLEVAFTEILLAFQDVFLAGLVTVNADDTAQDSSAVKLEDAPIDLETE
jgi:hypothetical protein